MRRSLVWRRWHQRGGSDSGYSLMILVMAITTLNILIAMSLPVWSQMIRRDKEEELIFRGLQYAEAIRRYQARTGGNLPVRMDALLKEEPRTLRQFWRNPMREDGKWTLILQNSVTPGGQPGGQGQGQDLTPPPQGESGSQPGRPGQPPQPPTIEFDPENPEAQQVAGPIIGVYSSEGGESVKVWNNSQMVSEWQFRADMFGFPAIQGDLILQCPPVNAAWLARPFPPGINPPCLMNQGGGQNLGGGVGGGLPGGGPPGGGGQGNPGGGDAGGGGNLGGGNVGGGTVGGGGPPGGGNTGGGTIGGGSRGN